MIKMNCKRRCVLTLVVAAVLLLSMVGMVSATQTWKLSNDHVMYKDLSFTGGFVTISASEPYIWTANEAAQCDVGFAAKNWTGSLRFLQYTGIPLYRVEIGYSDVNGANFVSKGTNNVSGIYTNFNITADAFTVTLDKYLAFQVTNTGSYSFQLATKPQEEGERESEVRYPEDSPAYPVPELPTVLLMGIGVLALVGYVVLMRRTK